MSVTPSPESGQSDGIRFLPEEEGDSPPRRPVPGNVVSVAAGASLGLLRALLAEASPDEWVVNLVAGAALGYVCWILLVVMIRGFAAFSGEEPSDVDDPANQP
jgi:hypothetical protein